MAPFLKDSAVVGMLIHQCQKPVPVFVREKYRQPVIATLRDALRDDPRFSERLRRMGLPSPPEKA